MSEYAFGQSDLRLYDSAAAVRPVTVGDAFRQNTGMRDVAHGAIGALIAYAVYKLAGHAGWSLAALVLYVPIYLALRDRFPPGRRSRAEDRN